MGKKSDVNIDNINISKKNPGVTATATKNIYDKKGKTIDVSTTGSLSKKGGYTHHESSVHFGVKF